MGTYAERMTGSPIMRALTGAGTNQSKMARELGITSQSVGQTLNGRTSNARVIALAAEKLNTSEEAILELIRQGQLERLQQQKK